MMHHIKLNKLEFLTIDFSMFCITLISKQTLYSQQTLIAAMFILTFREYGRHPWGAIELYNLVYTVNIYNFHFLEMELIII